MTTATYSNSIFHTANLYDSLRKDPSDWHLTPARCDLWTEKHSLIAANLRHYKIIKSFHLNYANRAKIVCLSSARSRECVEKARKLREALELTQRRGYIYILYTARWNVRYVCQINSTLYNILL